MNSIFQASLFFLIVAFVSSVDGQQTKIDYINGVKVVTTTPVPYGDLPESFRSLITPDQYRRQNESSLLITADLVNSITEKGSSFGKSRIRNPIRSFGQAVSILDQLSSNKSFANLLDFVPSQESEYRKLKSLFEKERKRTLAEESPQKAANLRKLKYEFAKRYCGIFLPHQFEILASWNPANVGEFKMLASVDISDALGLSETQVDELKEKSQAIADEIDAFIKQKRKEASQIKHDVLSKRQLEKLHGIISKTDLETYAGSASFEVLSNQLNFKNWNEDK